MNADELKALVEAVKTVSGDAREVLLWYFGLNVIESVLWFAFWLIAIARILRTIHWLISNGHVSRKIAVHIGADQDYDRLDHHNRDIHQWVDNAIERDKMKVGRGT